MRAGAGLRHLLMQKLFSALATKTSSAKINFLSFPLSSSSYEPLSSLFGVKHYVYKHNIYSLLFELHKNGYEIKYTNIYIELMLSYLFYTHTILIQIQRYNIISIKNTISVLTLNTFIH